MDFGFVSLISLYVQWKVIVAWRYWHIKIFLQQNIMKQYCPPLFITLPDWRRESGTPGCPRIYPLPRWPFRGSGPWPHYPEVPWAEEWRWRCVLHVSRRVQPQPVQAAVPEPDEQRGADWGAEEGGTGGGCPGLWAQHTGQQTAETLMCHRRFF